VALALNDDDKPVGADGVLVLQGEQGCGKTRFFTVIAITPNWFAEGVSIDIDKKDTVIQATGCWIAELGELDATLKREQSALKAYLTAARDAYRLPYARAAVRRPRRTSFCATVNPENFLNDDTGSRRYVDQDRRCTARILNCSGRC
jgi:predicted P-loop ATPase